MKKVIDKIVCKMREFTAKHPLSACKGKGKGKGKNSCKGKSSCKSKK